jgi:predicted nucleic acid-binding protein
MILLDTSFLVAYSHENDENHKKAFELIKDIVKGKYGDPCISDYIFDETVTVVYVRTKRLKEAVKIGQKLLLGTEIVGIDDFLFDMSWNIFKNQKNREFSFTDCTTISIMIKKRITNLATFDKEFKKIKKINVIPE